MDAGHLVDLYAIPLYPIFKQIAATMLLIIYSILNDFESEFDEK